MWQRILSLSLFIGFLVFSKGGLLSEYNTLEEYDTNIGQYYPAFYTSRVQLRETTANRNYYEDYLYQRGVPCGLETPSGFGFRKDEVSFIVGVMSSGSNVNRRNLIRNSWAREIERLNGKVCFIVGIQQGNENMLKRESTRTNDVLMVPVLEGYENIIFKTISFLSWSLNVPERIDYIVKVDDDVYLNAYELVKTLKKFEKLEEYSNTFLYSGHTWKGHPIRDQMNKNYVSLEMYPFPVYPTYVQGACIMFNHNSVYVLEKHLDALVKGFLIREDCGNLEDVQIGIWMNMLGISASHDGRIVGADTCHKGAILVFDLPSKIVEEMHFRNSQNLCVKSVRKYAVESVLGRMKSIVLPESLASMHSHLAIQFMLMDDYFQATMHLKLSLKFNAQHIPAIQLFKLLEWFKTSTLCASLNDSVCSQKIKEKLDTAIRIAESRVADPAPLGR